MSIVNGSIQKETTTGLTRYYNAGAAGITNLTPSENSGSSGWVSGGLITAVGDAAPDITAGVGYVYDTGAGTYTRVAWSAVSNLAMTNNAVNYISVNSAGVVSASTTDPSHAGQRTAIQLGRVSMTSGVISGITSTVVQIQQGAATSYDIFKAYGTAKSGLTVAAASTNLTIAVSLGEIYSQGVSAHTTPNSPNEAEFTANSPQTYRMFTQTGVSGGDVTVLPVGSYDNAGTVTSIPGASSQATIFTVYKFSSGNVRIFYGQTIYSSLNAAVAAVGSYAPIVPASFSDAIILGYIVATKSATNLANSAQATFINTNRFGGVGGAIASAGGFMLTDFSNVASGANLTTTGTVSANTLTSSGLVNAATGFYLNANNNFLHGRNFANSAYLPLIGLNASDQVSIASGGAATVFGGTIGSDITLNYANPTVMWQNSGATKLITGISTVNGAYISGSLVNDAIFRTAGGKVLFSTDDGTSSALTLNGNTLEGKALDFSSSLPGAAIHVASNTSSTGFGSYLRGGDGTNYSLYVTDYSGATGLFTVLGNGTLTVGTTPTTSAGSYDILTRNSSTGVVEKVASATLTSGLYATTATLGTNAASTSSVNGHYQRIGNEITMTGTGTIQATTGGGTTTVFSIDPVVASNFTAQSDAQGTGMVFFSTDLRGLTIQANSTTDKIDFTFPAANTSSQAYTYTLMYTVK